MATSRANLRVPALLAAALTALAMLLAAGPGVERADAASACKRYGDVRLKNLRNGDARRAVLCFLNRERSSRGIPKLDRDRRLQKASQNHNDYMQATRCFAHQCPGERSLLGRLSGVGYIISGLLRWSYGENIAWGGGKLGTPRKIVVAWMNSPGHRANILNSGFREVGVGVGKGSPYSRKFDAGTYTTDFGLRILG